VRDLKTDELEEQKEKGTPIQLTSERKLDHIRICLTKDVQPPQKKNWLQQVEIIHNALPEIDMSEVKTETVLFGKKISAPLVIAGMTGGHSIAKRINEVLAKAAEETRIGMGVGSQRAAIEDPSLVESYSIVRRVAPDVPIIANLGAPQLSKGYGIREARKAIEMVEADALAIHLNPLQEAVQMSGDTNARGILKGISLVASQIDVPVIAKETGCGIAYEEARRLAECGIKAVDVGGAGGTSWSAVEAHRDLAQTSSKISGSHLGFTFANWGIPTAASIVEVSAVKGLTVIATGGVRDGIDVAKCLALGAHSAGMALPFLKPAYSGDLEALKGRIKSVIRELRTAMFLTGSAELRGLTKTNLVIRGELAEWLRVRGFDPENFARRRVSDP
jgi:isopentenyl-diphosphate delta-isomerase